MAASFKNWIEFKARKNQSLRYLIDFSWIKMVIDFCLNGNPLSKPTIVQQNEKIRLKLREYSNKSFNQIKEEFEEFYAVHSFIDYDAFDYLLNEFRNHFPNNYRISGISYFDDLVENLIQEYETKEGGKKVENPHPEIFINAKCWNLFEHLKCSVRNELADLSYIFKKMKGDGFIYEHIGNKDFIDWLNGNYGSVLDRILNPSFNKLKDSNYSTAKRLFNLHSIKKNKPKK